MKTVGCGSARHCYGMALGLSVQGEIVKIYIYIYIDGCDELESFCCLSSYLAISANVTRCHLRIEWWSRVRSTSYVFDPNMCSWLSARLIQVSLSICANQEHHTWSRSDYLSLKHCWTDVQQSVCHLLILAVQKGFNFPTFQTDNPYTGSIIYDTIKRLIIRALTFEPLAFVARESPCSRCLTRVEYIYI